MVRVARWRVCVAITAIVMSSSSALADAPQIADARRAIDEVRYDDAQRLLIAALEAGGNSPSAVRDIYKLLGASAVALGKTDDAEKYYRAWIALDPKAALDAGASPKLRAPFDAAKSYVTANGPLDVVAEYVSGEDVRVRVISDPLSLARTAKTGDRAIAIVDRSALVPSAPRDVPVLVVDRYGNTLVELRATGTPPPPHVPSPDDTTPEPRPLPAPGSTPPPRPTLGAGFYALAVPAGLLLAAGVGFGAASYIYNDKVQTALENSSSAYFTDVQDQQKKVTQYWKLSAAIGGAGLVLALPAALLYKRSREAAVVPYVDGNSAGAAVMGRF